MLFNTIMVAIITIIVYGIRYILWKEKVPESISKYRWLIAIVCSFTFLIIGGLIQYSKNPSLSQNSSTAIYGVLLISIADALKNKEEPKQSE